MRPTPLALAADAEFSAGLDIALTALRLKACELALEQIPELLGKLAEMKALLEGRYLRHSTPTATEDRLLTVAEAAERLSVSRDYLYRNSHRLPFTVRQGRCLRFSAQALESHIRRRRSSSPYRMA